ncbi:MAG: right-handed parallel beta-helix repeat-containing protein, partial [Lentisphaerae bacterium]|nr:right-handed parallel beta-helix repeat-containing protein [Lentisphaerota bacterium]
SYRYCRFNRYENCDVSANGSHGIYLYDSSTGGNSGVYSSTYIINCVIYSNNACGIYAHNDSDPVIENTIIARNKTYGIQEAHNYSDPTLHNCCFHTNGTETAYYRDYDTTNDLHTVVEINALSVAVNTNNIAGDPLFLDAASGDFRIDPVSVCVDAGTTTTDLDTDFYGNVRLSGPAVDIGIYEYVPLPAGTVFMFW